MNALNLSQQAAFIANEQDAYNGDYIVHLMADDIVIIEELDDIVLCLGYDD